jgi:uncharacterized protein
MQLARTPTPAELKAFASKWHVREIAIFGSRVHDRATSTSDLDVLLTFDAHSKVSYWDWPQITDDLAALFGTAKIDLVDAAALTNPFRKDSILASKQTLYAA